MPRLAVSGSSSPAELNYADTEGDGRPVVLIHGWPLHSAAWVDNIPALNRSGNRAITYDRRGFGRSSKPVTGYHFDQLADDLAALIDGLDLHDVTLVGFSMGGGEVVRYIARHGTARIHSIVLASAITPYLLNSRDNPDGPVTRAETIRMSAALTVDRGSFFDDFISRFFSVSGLRVSSQREWEAARQLCDQAGRMAALQTMAGFVMTDFRPELGAIDIPTLVIHGDGDATVPIDGSGRRTHLSIPHSELQVIEGGPHGIHITHREEFDNALTAFLAR